MPVVSLVEIAAVATQVGLIGTAVFGVCVLIYGLKTARRAL